MSAREVLAERRCIDNKKHPKGCPACYHDVDQDIAALSAAGFVIVPREPTGDMLVAGGNAQQTSTGSWGEPGVAWRAMLSAAEGKK